MSNFTNYKFSSNKLCIIIPTKIDLEFSSMLLPIIYCYMIIYLFNYY